jgi:hypothetical protein
MLPRRCWFALQILALFCTAIDAYVYKNANISERACTDFNTGAAVAAAAGFENVFVCPADGIARAICQERLLTKNATDVVPSTLKWDDVVLYMLMGPNKARVGSEVEAFMWWVPLMTDPVDIVVVGDACPAATPNCTDKVANHVRNFREKFPIHRFHVVRAHPTDSGYNILSCKMRTGANLIYNQFPQKTVYFKLDLDTIVFPRRLLSFLQTLDAVSVPGAPWYFGTIVESGMSLLLCGREAANKGNLAKGGLCYAQGGAGYGLNNVAMKVLAEAPRCNTTAGAAPDTAPEDTFVAGRVWDAFQATVVHCGGFSSSEIVTDVRMRGSISFHYVDNKFLRTHGENLLRAYKHSIRGK